MEDPELVTTNIIRELDKMKSKHYGLFISTAEAYIKMCKQEDKLQRELIGLFRKYVELSTIDPRLKEIADCIDHALTVLPEEYNRRI